MWYSRKYSNSAIGGTLVVGDKQPLRMSKHLLNWCLICWFKLMRLIQDSRLKRIIRTFEIVVVLIVKNACTPPSLMEMCITITMYLGWQPLKKPAIFRYWLAAVLPTVNYFLHQLIPIEHNLWEKNARELSLGD